MKVLCRLSNTCVMIGQFFCVAMRDNDCIWGPTFEEKPDESFLHSLTKKVRHDWPIFHAAMREMIHSISPGPWHKKITETLIGCNTIDGSHG